ncbi:hypothetical protein AB0J43_00160 [Nonomuraea fuscirosea]
MDTEQHLGDGQGQQFGVGQLRLAAQSWLMSEPVVVPTMERLSFIRLLHQQGIDQSRVPRPFSFTCVLTCGTRVDLSGFVSGAGFVLLNASAGDAVGLRSVVGFVLLL